MESLARRALDALPVTVYAVDLEGRITLANRAWHRFAASNGAPHLAEEGSAAGLNIWDAIVERSAREQVQQATELIRSGKAATVTWEFPCSSPEEERVFLMQVSPLHADRAIAGFVFSTVDITPSHRSREALIDAGIALSRTIALDRVYHEVAQQARRAVPCEAFALAVADDGTRALRLAYHSGFEDPPEVVEQRLQAGWSEALASSRVLLRDGGGTVALTAPMTSAEGVLGAMTLITDRIESPQRLDEAQRVLATLAAQAAAAIERAWLLRRVEHKRRLEAIGEVSTGVAHELRNPLFGISSAAQLLRFRAREDPVVEKNVGRVLREVERLNRMVTSLLEYGRPHPLRLADHDPDAIWDDVLELHRGRLESSALQLRRTRAAQPARCRVDAEQIAQVFVNILVNAIDAAPQASDLTLVSETLPTGFWRCRLRNAGPALPPEALARVFEIFFSTKAGGTGIGLALCQRIMEEHRGSIALESAAEKGTTCTLLLPLATA